MRVYSFDFIFGVTAGMSVKIIKGEKDGAQTWHVDNI